jgi:hypothetical protein
MAGQRGRRARPRAAAPAGGRAGVSRHSLDRCAGTSAWPPAVARHFETSPSRSGGRGRARPSQLLPRRFAPGRRPAAVPRGVASWRQRFHVALRLARSSADAELGRLLQEDAFVYSGYSAGPCVLAPSLRGLETVDNPDVVPEVYGDKPIWDGLGVLNYAIVPHVNSPDHPESGRSGTGRRALSNDGGAASDAPRWRGPSHRGRHHLDLPVTFTSRIRTAGSVAGPAARNTPDGWADLACQIVSAERRNARSRLRVRAAR